MKEFTDWGEAAGSPAAPGTFGVDQSLIMIFEWDLLADTITYSKNWAQRFGHEPGQQKFSDYLASRSNIYPDDFPVYQSLWERVRKGVAYASAQLRIMNARMEYVWYRLHVVNQYGEDEKPVKATGILFDIDDEMRALEELRCRAEQDALTGLLNREETEARIRRRLLEKPDQRCALFMVDTDNFKRINDSKGHMLGDIVLAEMAAGMKKQMRTGDVVGRIGGDEFMILMADIPSRAAAAEKAAQLEGMFRRLFENEKQVIQVTCSIGVALYPEDGADYKELYQCADRALYQAKKLGKNQYALYDAKQSVPVSEAGYSSLGAAIDSMQHSDGIPGDLISLVFKILYEMADGERAIDLILEIVGKRFDVSRAYVFECSGIFYNNTYEWCSEGVVPEKDNLQNLEYANYADMFGDDSVFYCRDTGTLPQNIKELLEAQGICSTLQCAIWEEDGGAGGGRQFGGFVGFDECTGLRLWTQEEVAALSLISEILTTFLLKKRLLARNRALISRELEVARAETEQRRAAEKSIVDCIQWLSASEYLEDAIDYVLHIVQEYYRSDRVYIIETDEERGIACNTYEICAEGVTPQIGMLQEVPIKTISFWMEQFEAHDCIKVDDVSALGEDREQEREILKAQGVNGLMAVPLHVKGAIKGFLGIDDPREHKEEIHYLSELSYFLANEITKNALKRSLERLSYQDAMTGLENRNSYSAYCDDVLKRLPAPLGVVFMDINGLKKLNDLKGHVYGDMLITHTAELMGLFFPEARKFRLSGDEFLLVTERMPYDVFKARLSAMEEAMTENGRCAAAVGTAWSDADADLNELMNKADRLMYLSKRDYYAGETGLLAEKIPLLRDLKESILNREFLIYLQPKLNLRTGRVDGAEALVRYREKDGAISSPIKFVPFLEGEGLIDQIDFFVMEEVCRTLAGWKDTALSGMKLALNFSRLTLCGDRFWERFKDVFRRYDLLPGQLEVEITETRDSLNKKEMALALDRLKEHGFSIGLDDFGVEYSSYEFLMMADFDLLKIDKGIVQKYEESEKGAILVEHIVDMSHSIGIPCCAEGVETQTQLQFLEEVGCDYVQGYLVDRPMPVERFEAKYGRS